MRIVILQAKQPSIDLHIVIASVISIVKYVVINMKPVHLCAEVCGVLVNGDGDARRLVADEV